MNILYIVPYKYLKPSNGGGYCIYYVQQYLGEISNLVVAGSELDEPMEDLHFKHIKVFGKSTFRYINIFNYFKLLKIIKQHKIETLVFEHPYLAWLAYWLKKTTHLPLMYRSVNVEYLRFKSLGKFWWPVLRIYERWAHRNADFVWCVTREDSQQITTDNSNSSCSVLDLPYGTTLKEAPSDKEICKDQLKLKHGIASSEKIILFNGSLNYTPNRIGLDAILDIMNPILMQSNLPYKIIICGSKLPESYHKLEAYQDKNIIYAGFVDDVSIYFKGADLFLNPVIGGGGIKTKLVEALAFNTQSISSENGAIGLYPETTGSMLLTVKDYDWQTFANKIIECLKENQPPQIPASFYAYYYWGYNLSKVVKEIKDYKSIH